MTAFIAALAPEVVADEHPGGDRPEDGVDERDDDRGAEAELQRGDGLGARDGVPEPRRPVPPARPDERGDRQHDDDREEDADEAEREGRPRPSRSHAVDAATETVAACAVLASGPSDLFSICAISAPSSNHFLSAARQPPNSFWSSILKMPGRLGILGAVRLEHLRVDRPEAVLGEELLRTGRLHEAEEPVHRVEVVRLRRSAAIGSSISIVWRGITYWMS